jgi:DHA1 family multidrug resistance protein-like MFS transporter
MICLISVSSGTISAFLYVYLTEIGASYFAIGWVQLFSSFILAVAYLFGGVLSDHFGGRRVFLIAVLCSLCSIFIFNAAFILYIFVFGILVAQLAAGLRETSAFVVISSSTTTEKRATALGLVRTFQYGGALIAPIAGGIIAYYYGIRSIFLLPIFPLISAFMIGYLRMKVTEERKPRQKYIFSWSKIKEVASIDRNIKILVLMSFFGQFFMEFGNPYYMIFMKNILGAPDTMIGIAASALSLGSIIAGIPSGFVSDFIRRRKPLILLSVFVSVIAVVLTAIAFNPTFVVITYFLFGISNVVGLTATQAYVSDTLPESMRGLAFSVIVTFTWLGGTFSPPIAGAIAQSYGLRVPFGINAIGVLLEGAILWIFLTESLRQ